MNNQKQKWLTCTPKSFIGSARFFTRDSGLLSEGFRMLGYDAQAIMLGPEREDDDPRILRASMEQLCDVEFWRSLGAVGVVFYGWAMPRYTPICKAIKEAGLKLVINLDTAGLLSLAVNGQAYSKIILRSARRDFGLVKGLVKGGLSLLRSAIPSMMDKPRLVHLQYANLIGAVSPIALSRLRLFASHYGDQETADKLRLVPHPISPEMKYNGEFKEKKVCIIGRWRVEDSVKRPELTLRVLAKILRAKETHEVVIVGDYDENFSTLVGNLPESIRQRVKLTGRLSNDSTALILRTSQISICFSESESFHIASAEALCSGCSVISYHSPYLPSFKYFVAGDCGHLAVDDTEQHLSEAVIHEIENWDKGRRCPKKISDIWCDRLHADKVAQQIIDEIRGEQAVKYKIT